MSESPTGDTTEQSASPVEPTEQQPVVQPAESQNQETTSQGQPQGAVSDDESAQQEQNKNTESGTVTDDGLAKFAKSQGIDLENATDNEKRLLKIAQDNQRAARSNGPKVTDAAKELGAPAEDATEVQKLHSKVQQMEYTTQTDKFWSQQGMNRELEPTMVEILQEKKEQIGKDYAFQLSQDLETLYGLAQMRSGANDPSAAKEEGRREAITSIRKAQVAGTPQAHAVQSAPSSEKIDANWVENTYNPSNPEHVKILDSYMRGDLY